MSLRQTKHPRSRVAGLWSGRDSTDFDEAKAKRRQSIDVIPIFVQTRSKSDRIRERQAHHVAYVSYGAVNCCRDAQICGIAQ